MAECVVVDGKVVYLDLCGCSHQDGRTRMSERTLFRGYSMMKPVTAVACMTLVEEGALRLDDPVSRYIPKFRDLKVCKKNGAGVVPLQRPMTVRHLIMHTSGFGYGPGIVDRGLRIVARSRAEKMYKDISLRQDSGEIDTLEKLCDALADRPLLFQPGSAYEYGLSFDVLGRVMEVASGRPLRALLVDRVLKPCGMLDTCWDVPRAKAGQVCGYYRILQGPGPRQRVLEKLDGAKVEHSAYVRGSAAHYPGRAGVPSGGGFWGTFRTGLLFSMRDVLLFCQMLLGEGEALSGARILQATTVRALRRNWLEDKRAADRPMPRGWTSDAVGWNPLGHVELTGPHAGAIYMGGMSYFWMDPRRRLASAIMTETYWQVQPIGWRDSTDTMEEVLQTACAAAGAAAGGKRGAAGRSGSDPAGRAAKVRRTA